MTKRIHEAASLRVDPTTKALRVCLISEGSGSSADFPRTFFTQENADRLARSLSFPGHPKDQDHPEWRDPLSAIARIGENVTIEIDPDTNLAGFWSDYKVSKSRPDVQSYLEEYGEALGLSIFSDSEGHEDRATGKWVAESLTDHDPYRSVDLVVAAGRGGKFDRVAEALRKITEASATAGEKEEIMEIKELAEDFNLKFAALSKVVEGLAATLEGKAKADLQIEVDDAAVNKAVESRLADYDKAVTLISEAHLTESQAAELRALALKGEDITDRVESAKKILTEALALAGIDEADDEKVTRHLGESARITSKTDAEKSFAVAGFGEVR